MFMTNEAPISQESGTKSVSIATEISYCPHLDIYHYRRADGSDYMFNTEQLKLAIEGWAKQGDQRQAEFMAVLTGLGRRYPHKVVSFDDAGKCVMRDLEPAPQVGDDEVSKPG
jgi:hypothetical protein